MPSGTPAAVVGEDQLAVGTCDVAGERVTAPGRVESDGYQPGQRGRDQHGGEERGVAQQHPDVRRLGGVEPCHQRGGQFGGGLDVVAAT